MTLKELGERGPVLLVLSEIYGKALSKEIHALGETGDDILLVGGDRDIPGIHRIPSNRALRHALGGTLTSLNARMAMSWLDCCPPRGRLTSSDTIAAWNRWSEKSKKVETYDRKPMADEAVKAFIQTEKQAHPNYSRTRLLRILRENGMACEQKRFATLYVEAMGDG
ncbi:hypothetical protein MRI28_16290 [Nocardiopsis dassonvillei]|uniref:hypothetical protein n=1 Tax=Nocardiopsis dassonvillei TaxID=2014 RepID=UPI0020107FE8|nr:hypothetical protein [Nocardiopsis dassonvillei]MCK9871178.1 hypothetical protein [Nocardiopsis dassonvillei]